MVTRRAAIGMTWLVLVTAATAAAQTPQPPTFRSSAQLVEVDVRVTDRNGRFVDGLTRDDFEVLEDGVPQPVEAFFVVTANGSRPDDPAPLAAPAAAVPPAHSSRQAWVFAFDILHLSPGGLTRARDALARFLADGFADGDLGGVLAGGAMANNRLTSDRAELQAAALALSPASDMRTRFLDLGEWPAFRSAQEAWRIDRSGSDRDLLDQLRERACRDRPEACRRVGVGRGAGPGGALAGDVSAGDAIAEAAEEHVRDEIRQKARRLMTELRRDAHQMLRALDIVVSRLARLPGRKNVVLFTEGFFIDEAAEQIRAIVGSAARAGVTFYAIDARGLDRSGQGFLHESSAMELSAAGEATFDDNSDGANSLAVDTGGFVVRNENNVGRALDRISADARHYYVLGYRPTNATYDGTFRRIRVNVRKDGLTLRARRGYVAAPPNARPVLTTTAPAPAVHAGVSPGSLPGVVVPVPPPAARAAASASAILTPDSVGLRPGPADRLVQLAPAAVRTQSRRAMEGWTAYERGDLALASRLLTEAAEEPGALPWVHYALGFALLANGHPADAARSWERARAAAPEFHAVYLDLADVYMQLRAEGNAVAVLREAQRRWPADADTHNALGVAQVRRGAMDDAVESFQRAIEGAPDDPLGYFNLARTYQLRYLKSRRYNEPMQRWVGGEADRDRAIAQFEKCIALGGPYVTAARDAVSALSWR